MRNAEQMTDLVRKQAAGSEQQDTPPFGHFSRRFRSGLQLAVEPIGFAERQMWIVSIEREDGDTIVSSGQTGDEQIRVAIVQIEHGQGDETPRVLGHDFPQEIENRRYADLRVSRLLVESREQIESAALPIGQFHRT